MSDDDRKEPLSREAGELTFRAQNIAVEANENSQNITDCRLAEKTTGSTWTHLPRAFANAAGKSYKGCSLSQWRGTSRLTALSKSRSRDC